MRREVDCCRRILERMRIDAGDSAGERFIAVPVRELVAYCLLASPDGASPAAKAAVEVDLASGASELLAVVPRRAFSQVLRGLIDNARDASPAGGPVLLRVRAGRGGLSGQVTFEVADSGTGIPADVLAHIGEPFFTTKPAGKGMGLGVFLARTVIERLGGSWPSGRRPVRGPAPPSPFLPGRPHDREWGAAARRRRRGVPRAAGPARCAIVATTWPRPAITRAPCRRRCASNSTSPSSTSHAVGLGVEPD